MDQLPADYFGELARQLAFVSAVLGGFAATFFGTLLAVDSPKKVAGWAASCAAVAAACFVCATLTATFIAVGTHPSAPAPVATDTVKAGPRVAMVLSMMIGLYALFGSLGAGGWVRSRAVGTATTVAAALGAAFATWAISGF